MSMGYTLDNNGSLVSPFSLGCCASDQEAKVAEVDPYIRPKKKEKNMNRVNIEDISVSIEAKAEQTDERQREYLDNRLLDAYTRKWQELRKQFYMDEDESPQTAKELVDRITSGKFILPTDEEQKKMIYWGYSSVRSITWRDPAHPADKAGLDAAVKVLDKMYQDTKDDIRIAAPADGLKILRTFQDASVVATTA